MTPQDGFALKRVQVPDPNSLVSARRKDNLIGLSKTNLRDYISMAQKGEKTLKLLGVPYLDSVVVTAGNYVFSGGGPADGRNTVRVSETFHDQG